MGCGCNKNKKKINSTKAVKSSNSTVIKKNLPIVKTSQQIVIKKSTTKK